MQNHSDQYSPADEEMLRQVDALIEKGKKCDHAVMNSLVNMTPQADRAFQNRLEKRLIAQLQEQHAQERSHRRTMTIMTRAQMMSRSLSNRVAVAILLVISALAAFTLMRGYEPIPAASLFTSQVPIEPPPQTVVIATENIQAGDTITDDMIAQITLSMEDFADLQDSYPGRIFFTDVTQVIGEVTTTAIFASEPIVPIKLGQLPSDCGISLHYCDNIPEDYYAISFSTPLIGLAAQGLVVGDRADVLATADNQLSVIVEDVLVIGAQDDLVTFAVPSWKLSMLAWLSNTSQPYTLLPSRLMRLEPLTDDEMWVEYTFTSPEALPDDYVFDLIMSFPVSEGYNLTGEPARFLEHVGYTERSGTMNFWFTDIDVISITDETEVVIRLPETQAAALDFLISRGAAFGFNPDADRGVQSGSTRDS